MGFTKSDKQNRCLSQREILVGNGGLGLVFSVWGSYLLPLEIQGMCPALQGAKFPSRNKRWGSLIRLSRKSCSCLGIPHLKHWHETPGLFSPKMRWEPTFLREIIYALCLSIGCAAGRRVEQRRGDLSALCWSSFTCCRLIKHPVDCGVKKGAGCQMRARISCLLPSFVSPKRLLALQRQRWTKIRTKTHPSEHGFRDSGSLEISGNVATGFKRTMVSSPSLVLSLHFTLSGHNFELLHHSSSFQFPRALFQLFPLKNIIENCYWGME